MSALIKQHPALILNQDILDICKPLKRLDIDYFAHVHIDPSNQFTCLTSNAGFTEHYLRNQYYNVDIHMAQGKKLGSHVIWDMIERKGLSAKMHKEAGEFGIKHTFTIIEINDKGKNCYHFASSTESLSINQTYLANLDLLKLFLQYFNEKVQGSRELSRAYQLKFFIASDAPGYLTSFNSAATNEKNRDCFLKTISPYINNRLKDPMLSSKEIILPNRYTHKPVKLTSQQIKCLNLLALGKTNKQIAMLLNLSIRTVENYFDRIRTLLSCGTSKELLALYYSKRI